MIYIILLSILAFFLIKELIEYFLVKYVARVDDIHPDAKPLKSIWDDKE